MDEIGAELPVRTKEQIGAERRALVGFGPLALLLAACGKAAPEPARILVAESSEANLSKLASALTEQGTQVDTSRIGLGVGQERAQSFNVIGSEELFVRSVEPGDTLNRILSEAKGKILHDIVVIPNDSTPIEHFIGGSNAVRVAAHWELANINLIKPGYSVLAGPDHEFDNNWKYLKDWIGEKTLRTYAYHREGGEEANDRVYDYLTVTELEGPERRGEGATYRVLVSPTKEFQGLERHNPQAGEWEVVHGGND